MTADFDELQAMLGETSIAKDANSFLKHIEAYNKKQEQEKKERDEWLKTLTSYVGLRNTCTEVFDLANTLNPADPKSINSIYGIDKLSRGLPNFYKSFISYFGDKEKLTFEFGGERLSIEKSDIDFILKTAEYFDQCLKSWGQHPLYRKLMREDLADRTRTIKDYF